LRFELGWAGPVVATIGEPLSAPALPVTPAKPVAQTAPIETPRTANDAQMARRRRLRLAMVGVEFGIASLPFAVTSM
jgi:hypothetical protein